MRQTPTVFMTSTLDGDPVQTPIPFADPPSRSVHGWGYGESFGIWSCRFSADGNEVVAGGSGKIFGKSTHRRLRSCFDMLQSMISLQTEEPLKSLRITTTLIAAVGLTQRREMCSSVPLMILF